MESGQICESESDPPTTCGICATVLKNEHQRTIGYDDNARVSEDLDDGDDDDIHAETEVKCEPLSILNMITSVFHYPFSEINGCAEVSQKEVESWLIGQSPFLACENCSETVRDFHCQFLEFRNAIKEASRLSNALKLWGEFIIETGGGAVKLKDIEEAKQLQKRNRRRKRILESGSGSSEDEEGLDRRVTSVRRYRCAFCQEAFSTWKDLTEHISSFHDHAENEGNGDRFSESRRNEMGIGQGNVQAKTNEVIENEPSFGCPHCPKMCISIKSLKKHLLSHSTVKIPCPTCGKGFTRSDHLRRHRINIHGKDTLDSGDDDPSITSGNDMSSTEVNDHNASSMQSDDNYDDDNFEVGETIQPLDGSELKSWTQNNAIEMCEKLKETKVFGNQQKPFSVQTKTGTTPSQPQCLCVICDQKFRAISKLVDHMSSVHQVKIMENDDESEVQLGCALCPKTFSKTLSLSKHLRRVHSTSILPCSLCDKVFKIRDTLRRHERNIHGKVHQDDDNVSDKNASTNMGNHEGSKAAGGHWLFAGNPSNDEGANFNSDGDSKVVFSDQDEVAGIKTPTETKKHQTSQAPSKPQCRCTICDRKFPTIRNLTTHISSRHHAQIKGEENEYEEKLYGCAQCPNVYAKSKTLNKHFRSHSTLQLFCTTCGKIFKRQDHLRRHKRLIHEMERVKAPRKPRVKKEEVATKEKRHMCSDCGKAFLRKDILEAHMRVHTGETPFLCNECGKGFRLNRSLQEHIQTDHRLLRFSCSVCEKKFTRKTHLKHHEKMQHQGYVEKTFICEFPECGKAFKLKKHLVKHENIHNPSKDHVCNICGFSTKWKNNLTHHIRKLHEKQ